MENIINGILSECCSAPPDNIFSSDLKDGICSKCKERSEFYDENKEKPLINND